MIYKQIELDGEGGQLLVWRTVEDADALLGELRLPHNRDAVCSVSSAKRRRELLAVRVALKHLLGREVAVAYGPSGKPCLPGYGGGVSISHSGEWVAVAVHPRCGVGIDIECPTEKVRRVAGRFLGAEERSDLAGIDAETDLRRLQIAWSAKEALYKLIGEEAVDFAAALRIHPFTLCAEGTLRARCLPAGCDCEVSYRQDEAYTLAWVIGRGL